MRNVRSLEKCDDLEIRVLQILCDECDGRAIHTVIIDRVAGEKEVCHLCNMCVNKIFNERMEINGY